ncbi:hypothetical protein GH714_041097 [Hevea brasiliensis]|uniref:Adenylate isopentenyltransferase n=1 Tax=Hevea brasiliensis TaxID=3981 RepID=A0A6A6MXB9_HEVBR|nr:hypothetical protein GH714_041097 [Hevea brasiliensis]
MDSSTGPTSSSTSVHHYHRRQKDKIVVIMGATGCGKTKLSIDLGTRFQSEIINSDKMQVYRGLDITTNKIPIHDRLGVVHHLLGVFDPEDGEVGPSEFRLTAGLAISDIVSRQKLPLIVGGSNSFIHALVVDRFNPELDVFGGASVSTQLRYKCCFIWVDVSLPLLCDYLCKRVDEMLDLGMFEELLEYFRRKDPANQPGLRKAIGVPEFDQYFKNHPPGQRKGVGEVGPTESGRDGGLHGGNEGENGVVKYQKEQEEVDGGLGERCVGAKHEDCEPLLGGTSPQSSIMEPVVEYYEQCQRHNYRVSDNIMNPTRNKTIIYIADACLEPSSCNETIQLLSTLIRLRLSIRKPRISWPWQKLTGLSSSRNDENAKQGQESEGVNFTTSNKGLKAVVGDDKESSCGVDDISPVLKPPKNPYFADTPLFNPHSVDFFCSPRPVYRYPDSGYASPSMANSIPPPVHERAT